MPLKRAPEPLIAILARTDALFEPIRPLQSTCSAAAVLERRTSFRSVGVPYSVSGSSTERSAGERELRRLQSAGLIRLHSSGKRIGASLTALGDDLARAAVGGWTVPESLSLVDEIEATKAAAGGATNAGFTCEAAIIGECFCRLTSVDLVALEQRAMPLIARGYVETSGDRANRLGYRTTTTGRAARAPGQFTPADFDSRAADLYDQFLQVAQSERDRWAPSTSHVAIPLGAGSWPEYAKECAHA